MKLSLYTKIINDLSSHLSYLMLYFQGEPFIHPSLFEMIKFAHQKGIYTVISTNGHFLNPENSLKTINSGLNRLIISVDGLTQNSYNIYRKGGDLNKVTDGINRLTSLKKKHKSKIPFIVVQSLVMRHNQSRINEIKNYFMNLGVNKVVFKSILVNDYKHGNPLIPSIDRYSRYKLSSRGDYIVKNPLKNKCWRMWGSSVITQDGTVIPCCFDKDAKYSFGNLIKLGFKAVWKNDKYNRFRESVLKSRKDNKICCNCTEGINRVLFK